MPTFAQISENIQQKEERERLERRGRVEKAKREIERHMQHPETAATASSADAITRMINELAAAELNYQAAKKSKDKNRSGYVIATIDLAKANFYNKEYDQASKFASEAYTQYELLGKDSSDESKCRNALWEAVGMLPVTEFQPKFEKLFRISEEKTAGDQQEISSHITSIPNQQERIDLDGQFDKAKFLKAAIDIRAAARGHNDASLYPLLDEYGGECQNRNEIPEAEKTFVWMSSLNAPSKWPERKALAQLRLARFYVDHNQFEKADAALPELLKLLSPNMNSSVANYTTWLGTQYMAAAHLEEADKIASAMLAVGGDTIVSDVHSLTDKLVKSYIDNFSFEKAQALMIKRVKASETCKNDWAAGLVQLELSNLDLALGQEAESNRLFDEVKKFTALKGRDMDKLIENREKLVQALKK